MSLALLVLAFLAQPEAKIHPWDAWQVVSIARETEASYRLPDGFLTAVVLAESGGRNLVCFPRAGGCDIGPAQVHLKHCDGHARWYLYKSIRTNLGVGAWLLDRSRRLCKKSGALVCRRCKWGLYNAKSKTWCRKVLDIHRRLRTHSTRSDFLY